jgi:hypothetical protein
MDFDKPAFPVRRVTGGFGIEVGISGHHTDRVERTRFMKGKPFLVAVAAFVIVLFGGVAIAGVGSFTGSDESDTAAHIEVIDEEPVKDEPVKDEPKDEPVKDEPANDEPIKEETAKDEPVDEESVKDEPEDEPAKGEPKAEEPVAEAPKDLFSITTPDDGSHVERKVVRFGGEVADGVTVHRGKYKAASEGGEWGIELVLAPGKNRVTFEAVHTSGKTEVETVTVYYDAPVEDDTPKDDPPKDEEPKDVAFTANQKYGSCGEEVPYDVFWGTAPPGSTIKVRSEFGSGSTEVGEKGHWELKVKFPTAPVGKTFEVTVKSSAGGSKTFTFTNTGGTKDH